MRNVTEPLESLSKSEQPAVKNAAAKSAANLIIFFIRYPRKLKLHDDRFFVILAEIVGYALCARLEHRAPHRKMRSAV